MENLRKGYLFLPALFIFCSPALYSQKHTSDTSTPSYKIVKAGGQYNRSHFYQWLMGKNYRKEWTADVRVPILLLDTAKGGLKAYKSGGGNQTKSVHVKTKAGKEYTLRTVDKRLGKVLPPILHGTFLEDVVNDEVSMSHPYAAASVPFMAERAGIYHTNPQFVYLQKQPLLDTFNDAFGNNLYLFEQRLSGNWKEAANLGNFEKFIDTRELLDSLHKDNSYEVDQELFARSRLFDMMIGDWDRHEDQWEWGLVETKDKKKVYQPVPQDRDQAYFTYDGVILKKLISAAGLKYFQAFDHTLPDVNNFNYEERNLDRIFTNRLSLHDWLRITTSLQQLLSNDVIETSVKQLPGEIYKISGNEIIAKLKSRRDHLAEYATTYYKFIAKEVQVVGSEENEFFEVKRVSDNETSIKVYRITKDGNENVPFYSRSFVTDETKEVRIFGLSGKDRYNVTGTVNRGITIRISAGNQKDSILDYSFVKEGTRKTQVYDNADNSFVTSKETKLHILPDTSLHSFRYANYLYDKKKIGPAISFNLEDRLFAGINAEITRHKWRQEPFAYKQKLGIYYSLSQRAMSAAYEGLFPKKVGKWDLVFTGNYDAVRWTKFFGLGNETPLRTNYNDFYRMRSEEWYASSGINRKFPHHNILLNAFFQSVRVINDMDRFVAKFHAPATSSDFNVNNFAGAKVAYIYERINDSIVPTKGVAFSGNLSYFNNLSRSAADFTRYSSSVQLYIPLLSKLSLYIKTGGITVTGNPLFYQYASIGGPETVRGYRLDRFWGKTAFYALKELRYITNIRSYIFNGKAGLLALLDDGRVWQPGEKSGTWHRGFGGGVLLAPFNKLQIVVTYAKSKEMKLFQLRVGRSI